MFVAESPEQSLSGPPETSEEEVGVPRTVTPWLVLGIVLAGGLLVGLGLLVGGSRSDGPGEWAGTILGAPQQIPDAVLTDTDGAPFDLRAETAGTTTIMMFGFTNCADVCPINLASLTAALDELGDSRASGIRVILITVDPERDTEAVLRQYLDRFDPVYVGLTGSPGQLAAVQQAANVPEAQRESADANGAYQVGHASQLIVYQEDGLARIAYPFGTRQADWTRDLPRLLDGDVPS
ncbi:MAG: SCO family protein [Actinobacteria bacterium]|nr:SCO family protein [Actinomycetota bacterium]